MTIFIPFNFQKMGESIIDPDGLFYTADREGLAKQYDNFNQKVINTVPAGRLLVFNVKQGWKPLCNFLNLPIPNDNYPRVNSSKSMQKNLIVLKILDSVIVGLVLFAVVFVLLAKYKIAGCLFVGYLSLIAMMNILKPSVKVK